MADPENESSFPEPPKPPSGSILGSLSKRREDLAAKQTIVLPVPRWSDPEILVRYGLVEHEYIRNVLNRAEKAKPRDRGVEDLLANCDVLIKGCQEIWGVIDGKKYSLDPEAPDGPFTRFDDRLAINLGLSAQSTARQVVRSLFLADGDIVATAGTVIEFCGYQRDAIEESLEGE